MFTERIISSQKKTTIMIEPMPTYLGYTALTPTGEAITNGIFINPCPHDEHLSDFLEAVHYHPWLTELPTLSLVITSADFIKTFHIINESKASSPSGRHFGIYKAMAHDEYLSQIGALMLFMPYMGRFAPERWKA